MTETEGDSGALSILHATPEAFRQALKERIARVASSDPLHISEIRRQFAYSRFLYRVFASGDSRWVLKGATGLLARIPSRARHSLDIDLMRRDDMGEAIKLLQALGHQHADTDFFTFDVQLQREPAPDATNTTLSTTAYLGEREFERFKIDLVVESNMTAEPEHVSPLKPVEIAGLRSVPYQITAPITITSDGKRCSPNSQEVDLQILEKILSESPREGSLNSRFELRWPHAAAY